MDSLQYLLEKAIADGNTEEIERITKRMIELQELYGGEILDIGDGDNKE